ncbi:MFS general substrate transporter [Suhomyces tanzawaensis NRRL Y-17324]|uniref:MFS general substrate transporter n=1 Tax=Suhomyces tanzawaensis NRRL Y-17324 TaxID=984487 RepID=A0A1E4SMU4_9ASCO|nr:MFS general substrate transporter [Suhomyces tanzawaensis NRRL Y-17324]ODV80808.1 MFS general substrate transporter [Suhomyces tanzawaensis NRRL Y-17324]
MDDLSVEAIHTNVELNDRKNEEFIPGTCNIYSNTFDGNETDPTSGQPLKRKGNLILIPQPSDSCNDPLNWSLARKALNIFILTFITGFTAATSNDAGATQDSLNEIYGIEYSSMNTGAGVLFASIAISTFILTPLASIYGRKLSYFICITMGMIGAIWFSRAKTTTDTIWSQLFVGVSESCAEAHVQLSLTDLSFFHSLGSVLTLYILATSIGTFLGPLIAGFIVQYTNFRWVGYVAAIISFVLLLVIVFVMDETYFDRSKFKNSVIQSYSSAESVTHNDEKPKNGQKIQSVDFDDSADLQSRTQDLSAYVTEGAHEPRKPYWQRKQLITLASNVKGTGFKQYCTQLRMLFKVFMYPPVIFGGLVWGIQDALLTFYLTVEDDNYYDAPYNYSNTGVALMNVPTLIGAVIGCFYAGTLSDYFTIWMAKRNKGIQEAESRLWFLILPGVFAPIGLVCFGLGTDRDWHWGATYFALGLVGFGFGCSGDVSMSYLMDAYPDMVIEMMCGVAVINNTIGCIFTFACSPWLDAMGITNSLIILAVIEAIIMLSCIVFIYYGKRIRIWTKPWYLEFCESRDKI